ncbi:MAG: rhodanese-like domain-containing protein [Firmicutes bacterium]|nr:rhodanese-like domain-containing protein [Bacillota bacterium]
MKKKLIFTIMLLLTGCGTATLATNQADSQNLSNERVSVAAEPTVITATAAAQMMEELSDFIILDVRTETEFNDGHIPNAVLMPIEILTPEVILQTIPSYDTTVLVYCRSGRRSASAAEVIASLGYTAVYDFGGILDWQGEIVGR